MFRKIIKDFANKYNFIHELDGKNIDDITPELIFNKYYIFADFSYDHPRCDEITISIGKILIIDDEEYEEITDINKINTYFYRFVDIFEIEILYNDINIEERLYNLCIKNNIF
jgi:hypothetical protein